MSFQNALFEEFSRLNLEVPESRVRSLAEYLQELEHWRKRVNLTGLEGPELVRRLVAEPCWVGERLRMSGSLADVGSGNGSPGIPLSITRGLEAVHLVEPRLKRAAFLRHVAGKLKLRGAAVYRERVEDVPHGSVRVDWISLQGIDATDRLLRGLKGLAGPTTSVVWITSGRTSPVAGARHISVPGSSTEVWVFGMDQF